MKIICESQSTHMESLSAHVRDLAQKSKSDNMVKLPKPSNARQNFGNNIINEMENWITASVLALDGASETLAQGVLVSAKHVGGDQALLDFGGAAVGAENFDVYRGVGVWCEVQALQWLPVVVAGAAKPDTHSGHRLESGDQCLLWCGQSSFAFSAANH